MKRCSPAQADMFAETLFPVRIASDTLEGSNFPYRLAMAMKRAAQLAEDEHGYDRHEIANRMARFLGEDHFSKGTLDAYISAAKTDHNISLYRFKAFVRATRQVWLADFAFADDGLTMLDGDEVRLANIAAKQQERDRIDAEIKALKSTPVQIKRRQRGARPS